MTDKLKEAAENHAPVEFTNCGGAMRSAFIAGATSPEAEEYWRGKHDKEMEAFLKLAHEKNWFLTGRYAFGVPISFASIAELLAMFRKEKGNE